MCVMTRCPEGPAGRPFTVNESALHSSTHFSTHTEHSLNTLLSAAVACSEGRAEMAKRQQRREWSFSTVPAPVRGVWKRSVLYPSRPATGHVTQREPSLRFLKEQRRRRNPLMVKLHPDCSKGITDGRQVLQRPRH